MSKSKLMDIDYLLESEIITEKNTLKNHGIAKDELDTLISILFRISHFLKEDIEFNTPPYILYIFAHNNYLKTPYNLKAVEDLWIKGYYLEATILNRHLLEGFIQNRYFIKHIDLIDDHLLDKKWVKFKTMFDEIIPGYYKKYYGNLSSRFAHSKLTTSIFRTDRESPEKARIIMGCEFNKGFSHSVIKTAIAYGYAYLNYTELFFPNFYSKIDTKMKNEILDILKSINSYFVIEKDHSQKGEYWDLMYSLIQK